MGLKAMLRRLEDAFIVDDPSPSYSALDLRDGLSRPDQLPADAHLGRSQHCPCERARAEQRKTYGAQSRRR